MDTYLSLSPQSAGTFRGRSYPGTLDCLPQVSSVSTGNHAGPCKDRKFPLASLLIAYQRSDLLVYVMTEEILISQEQFSSETRVLALTVNITSLVLGTV